MICKNCNFENPDDAAFCKECGMALSEKTVVLSSESQINGDPLSFSPGEYFGERYQIIEEIGEGGMGKVFKARDNELNIVVALKMIKPQLSADPNIISRFKKELLLAREIFHENVIRIHDLGEINGIKYISMNYIEGNSLQEILQSTGKLTIEKSIDITKQICNALSAAHNKGIIHRDLKPQNIMIDKKGNALVLDFGIARSLDSDSGSTQEGIVLGTPYFMSPEQIKGEKVDASTDIYSLGIIMYEIVTGKLPFTADSPTKLLHMHLSEKPKPPSQLNPQIPPMLERIILKCLEKRQKNRYRSIEAIMKDLEQDKTVQIPPLKVKEKKERRFARNVVKYTFRILIFLFIVYAGISILSLVNDFIYKTKIEKLEAKYDTHYQHYFPVQKDWLPAEWETRDCNGWETYVELFPPKSDKEGNLIPRRQYLKNEYAKNILVNPQVKPFDNITKRFEYENIQELKNVIANYGKYFKYHQLFDAIKCSKLNSLGTSQRYRMLYLPMVLKYADMTALDARIDFLEGNFETGMRKLYHFMIFTLDLFASSTYLVEDQIALTCFFNMCCELIPTLLCREMTIGSLSLYELDSLKAFGEIKKRCSPETYNADSPPVSEENIEAAMMIMQSLENLITTALKKFEPHTIFEKEYVSLIKDYGDIYGKLEMKERDYHIYGKLKPMFWEHLFSINRYFHKEGIEFYKKLLDRIKLTRDMHDKRMIINEYFKEHTTDDDDSVIIANVAHSAFTLNLSRTFGKLVLIIYTMNTYGLDSKEFLDLKSTDLFINELSGNKFEMIGEAPDQSIVLDKDFKLDLKKINYKEDHKEKLKSFKKDFDLKSEEQIRSLFYSFKPESE